MYFSFKKVNKSYLDRRILNEASFILKSGSVAYLEGEICSGKSIVFDIANNFVGYKKGRITGDFYFKFYIRSRLTHSEYNSTLYHFLYSRLDRSNYELFRKIYSIGGDSSEVLDDNYSDLIEEYALKGGYVAEEYLVSLFDKFKISISVQNSSIVDLSNKDLMRLSSLVLEFSNYPKYFVTKKKDLVKNIGFILFIDRPEYSFRSQDYDQLEHIILTHKSSSGSAFLLSGSLTDNIEKLINTVILVDGRSSKLVQYHTNLTDFVRVRLDELIKLHKTKTADMKEVERLHLSALQKIDLMEKKPLSKDDINHGKMSFKRINRAFVKLSSQASVLRNRAKRITERVNRLDAYTNKGRVSFTFPDFSNSPLLRSTDFYLDQWGVEVNGEKIAINDVETLSVDSFSLNSIVKLYNESQEIRKEKDASIALEDNVVIKFNSGVRYYVFGSVTLHSNLHEGYLAFLGSISNSALVFLMQCLDGSGYSKQEIIKVCEQCGVKEIFETTSVSNLSDTALLMLELVLFSLRNNYHFLIVDTKIINRLEFDHEMLDSMWDILDNSQIGGLFLI